MDNREKFVEELNVRYPLNNYKGDGPKMFPEGISKENLPKAFIADKGIVSFTMNTSQHHRQDVLDSVLLAQLAANYAYPNKKEMEKWYDEYMRVLIGIGWVIEKKTFEERNSNKDLIEMQNVILDILKAAVGGNYLEIVQSALKAFKALSESKDAKIIAFEKNTHSLNEGLFEIGLADQSNNEVNLQIGAFILKTKETIRQILFFTSHKSKTSLKVYTFKGTLNSNNYGIIRSAVKNKLGNDSVRFITELELTNVSVDSV